MTDMPDPGSTPRFRGRVAALAVALMATGIAGLGIVAAQAAPADNPAPLAVAAATTSPSPSSSASPTSSSDCPLPIPIPPICGGSSPSPSATSSTSASPSASATSTTSTTASPTTSPTSTVHPTPSSSSTSPPPAQKPTIYFTHQAATKSHPARTQIKIVANGSLITDLINVKLSHCDWNLGSPTAKHYKGGRQKLWIVVTRRHPRTVGSVQFTVVDAAGQKSFVKAHA